MPISVATPRKLPGVAVALRAIVHRTLAREAGEISIVLATDAELRELNRRWRRIDRATDVLSFPYDSAEPPEPASVLMLGLRRARARRPKVSGDLVISMDRVEAQARRYRVTRGRELARLVVHGVLHLAGHDHHAAGERRLMRAAEEKALGAVAAEIRRLDAALRIGRNGWLPKRPLKGVRTTAPSGGRRALRAAEAHPFRPRSAARARAGAASARDRRRSR